eukprot:scaffold120419_cov18-Tisochrysis_lutea.AAC.1
MVCVMVTHCVLPPHTLQRGALWLFCDAAREAFEARAARCPPDNAQSECQKCVHFLLQEGAQNVRQSQAGAALPSPPGGDPPRKPRLSVLGMPISSFADPQQQQRVSESGVKPATPPAQTLPIGESTTLSTAHSASLD